MKNLLTLVLLFCCITIFSQDVVESDFASEVYDTELTNNIVEVTAKQIISFDKKNLKVEVNSYESEVVKGVYFFDAKRKLISKIKHFGNNSSTKFNVEGISLVNVVTNKGYYFTLITKK